MRKSWIYILILYVVLFVMWLATKDLPYWWDSAGYVIPRTHQLLKNNFWPLGLGAPELGLSHPMLFNFILGGIWKVLGENLFASHLVNLIFAVIILTYTFRLARFLSKGEDWGNIVGFCAGLLLLFTPLFYAQLGIIYFELPVTAFCLMAVFYFLKGYGIKYFIFASAMLLSKETSIYIIIVLLLFDYWRKSQSTKEAFSKKIKGLLFSASPLLLLAGWFIFHKIMTGWFYIAPGATRGLPLELIPKQLSYVFQFMFVSQWRLFISLGLLAAAWKAIQLGNFKKGFKSDSLLLGLIVTSTILVFGLSEFLHRYIIIALPFFYLLFLIGLRQTFFNKLNFKQLRVIFLGLSLVLMFLFYNDWNNHRSFNGFYFPPLEENLEYQDIIAIGKQVSAYLQKIHPESTVYTSFPLDYMLKEPYQGYVTKEMKVKDCFEYKNGDKIEFMVFHYFSPKQLACAKLTQDLKFEKALKFERNGKFMMVYSNPSNFVLASDSAQAK